MSAEAVVILPNTGATVGFSLPAVASTSGGPGDWYEVPFAFPAPAALPGSEKIELEGQIAPGWQVVESLVVTVERERLDDGVRVLVYDDRVNVYGVGDTEQAAMDEYVSVLLDLFQELQDSADILSAALREQLIYLRSVLRPI